MAGGDAGHEAADGGVLGGAVIAAGLRECKHFAGLFVEHGLVDL